ncbi:Dabb family protein [Palleronia sp. KMU-117]|uniref:Dabb family protein n=1 Tax=Palleronia sp. KMU-117 TaxID=3434108 RepID=UPI003D714222
MIRHLVALRFPACTPAAAKAALMQDLSGLSDRIDGILDFQVRANLSPEDAMVRGFRDLFWFDFRDAAARDAYLSDPGHRAIGARLVAALDGGADGVLVCDFAP